MMAGKKYKKESRKASKKIALTGTKPGVGVTHTGILLAEFLKETKGAKVAFLEKNHHGDIEQLERMIYGYSREFFAFRGIDYYKESSQVEEEAYDYLILDFGVQSKKNQYEIKQCREKVLVGTLNLWEWQEYLKAAEYFQKLSEDKTGKYIISFGNPKCVSKMEKNLKQKLYLLGQQSMEMPFTVPVKACFSALD